MKPEIKQKWLNALRSGEYTQSQERLRSDDGYCCLGVLCDLYIDENKGYDWSEDVNHYLFISHNSDSYYEDNYLPFPVMEWACLKDSNPIVIDNDGGRVALSDLNDTGVSFNEIADYIEKQL